MGIRWVPTGSKTNPSTQTWTKQLFLTGKQPDQYKMASDPSHFSGEFARRRPGIRSCFRSRDIYGIHQESGAETAHLYLSVFVCVKRLAKRFLIVAFFFAFDRALLNSSFQYTGRPKQVPTRTLETGRYYRAKCASVTIWSYPVCSQVGKRS